MLARSFLTAEQLNINDKQHAALVGVLGMLERGEIVHYMQASRKNQKLFDMNIFIGYACCIGGWADRVYGTEFGEQYSRRTGGWMRGDSRIIWDHPKVWNPQLSDLLFVEQNERNIFSGRERIASVTVEQATHALSNYLTTGKADWPAVLNVISRDGCCGRDEAPNAIFHAN